MSLVPLFSSYPTEVVTDAGAILRHYLLSPRFLLDLTSSLPLEALGLFWLSSDLHWQYIALFRLIRIVKIWKVTATIIRHCGCYIIYI